MFATLVGTNTAERKHEALFEKLFSLAVRRGFAGPDMELPIEPDQTPLSGWTLTLKGSSLGNADFLLAVCAPQIPTASPIPVRKTVSGPLFSIVVLLDSFGIWHDFAKDYIETEDYSDVSNAFGHSLTY